MRLAESDSLSPGLVAALVSDLIFQTKITATAEQLGIAVRVLRASDGIAESVADACGLIVDLNLSTGDALDALRQARSALPALPVVAYCAHVQTDLAAAARAAGADEVMPKSAFTEQLPEVLRRLSEAHS